jgi:hypothetical protein
LDDNFINLDDEFDDSDKFERPIETDRKEPRKKVWSRTGNGKWEGERGLDLRQNEQFTGAGLYLSKRRSRKRLHSFEEADLIRAYRGGDSRAGDLLIESLLWLVRGIAGNQKKHGKLLYGRKFHGPLFDDRVAAGISGLRDAIEKYDFSHNTRLSTYARPWIMKSIGAECERWRYRGMGGQTRADRVLFNNTALRDDPELLAATAKCSLKSAEDAIERLDMTELPYDTREPGRAEDGYVDEGDRKRSPPPVDVQQPIWQVHPQGHIVTDDDWKYISEARARQWRGQDFYDQTVKNLREGWKGEKHYAKHWHAHELKTQAETLRPISRQLYASNQAKVHQDASAIRDLAKLGGWFQRSGKKHLVPRGGRSALLDRLAVDADQRAARRLKEIGRREYAIMMLRFASTKALYDKFRGPIEYPKAKYV